MSHTEAKLLGELRSELIEKFYPRRIPSIVFRYAATKEAAIPHLKEAIDKNFEVIPSSHGSENNQEIKYIFGESNYRIEYIEQLNKAAGGKALSILCPWYSCDFIHGRRNSQQVFDQEARAYIEKTIERMMKSRE